MIRRYSHILGPLLGIVLLAVALFALWHKLSGFSISDVRHELRHIPPIRLVWALLLTACYYCLTTAYDTLAFRFIGHPLPYRRIALASFTGYAFSHNVGLSVLSSGSVRYRVHSSFGLSATDTAKVVAFCSLSFWIGFLTICGVVFTVMPIHVPRMLHLPFLTMRIVGLCSLLVLLIYGWYTTHAHRDLKLFGIPLPNVTPRIFGLQMLIGSLDWLLASSVIFVLLPHADAGLFTRFFEIFVLAQIAGVLSQVPGGIGVFEGVLLLLLPRHSPLSAVIGALVVYRIIFYIVPLCVATLLLAKHEVRLAKRKIIPTEDIT